MNVQYEAKLAKKFKQFLVLGRTEYCEYVVEPGNCLLCGRREHVVGDTCDLYSIYSTLCRVIGEVGQAATRLFRDEGERRLFTETIRLRQQRLDQTKHTDVEHTCVGCREYHVSTQHNCIIRNVVVAWLHQVLEVAEDRGFRRKAVPELNVSAELAPFSRLLHRGMDQGASLMNVECVSMEDFFADSDGEDDSECSLFGSLSDAEEARIELNSAKARGKDQGAFLMNVECVSMEDFFADSDGEDDRARALFDSTSDAEETRIELNSAKTRDDLNSCSPQELRELLDRMVTFIRDDNLATRRVSDRLFESLEACKDKLDNVSDKSKRAEATLTDLINQMMVRISALEDAQLSS